MTPSIVSFCRGLPLNLIIPCVEIKIYGAAYPLPSSNNHLWSAHNQLRYIFKNLLLIRTNWKIVGSNFFGKLKIHGNLEVKSKVPPRSGSVALRMLNAVHKKGPSSCFFKKEKQTKKKPHEIKPAQKNESELGDIYIKFIYTAISF